MRYFFKKLLTLFLLLLSVALTYFATKVTFNSVLINLLLFVTGIFVLLQACGLIDEVNHFGKYNDDKNNDDN